MSEKENQLQKILDDILEDKNANLTPDNIKKGVTVLGVTGNLSSGIETSDATATKNDILAPKTAYINGGKVIGTMPDNGIISKTLSAGVSYTVPAGYTSGGKVQAKDLASQTVADATANDILAPKTAWVNGEKVTGGIETEYIDVSSKKSFIPVPSGAKFKYVGQNYAVVLTNTYVSVYKANDDETGTLLATYNFTNNSHTFTAGDINRGDISCYSGQDNDIKIVLPKQQARANTVYYFRFDCSKNTISYISSYQYGSGMYSSDQVTVKFPTMDASHFIFFGGQIGDDGTHWRLINITNTGMTLNKEIFYQKYYHQPMTYQFINNDSILCVTSWDNNQSSGEVLFIYYFSDTFTLLKTQIADTSYKNLIISQSVNYGYQDGTFYNVSYDTNTNTITKGNSITTVPTNYTFVGFVADNYIVCQNSSNATYAIFKLNNNSFENVFESNRIEINKDEVGFTNIVNGSYINIYDTPAVIGGASKLYSISLSNQLFMDVSGVNVAPSSVLIGNRFVSRAGDQFGTMPNNGALNYTAKETTQTIPAGYTSGGTIGAAVFENMSEYNACLELTQEILE